MNIKKFTVVAVLSAILLFVAACGNSGSPTASGGNGAGGAAAQESFANGSAGSESSGNGNAADGQESGEDVAFPTKPIELIVPFDAGGISDILARAFADAAQGIIGQPVTVKNIGGGSGTIGNYELVKSAPDGYTWLWAANGHIASTLHITEAQYTKDDFIIVNRVGEMSGTIVVPKDSPFRNLQDLINDAKENPGKLTVGLPGEGTIVALLAYMLADEVGVELEFVPFQGSGPLLPAVLGGHVQAAFMNVPEVRGQVDAGELRALAVLSEKRVDAFPDVPTTIEQGFDIAGGASHYIIIPLNVPDGIVAKIDELTKKVYESEKFREKMADINYQLGYKNGADARAEVDEWYEKTGELYRKLGLAK